MKKKLNSIIKKNYLIILSAIFYANIGYSQVWTLKLTSSVELRTYKLTNKIDESVEKLQGASIILYKGSSIVKQMQSDGNGDFTIDVPANGDFILSVTYSGCNSKKFSISTFGVPEELENDNYKPTFAIEGVIMAKPFPGINYSLLQQSLAKIIYISNGKKFDDDEDFTNQMLAELSKMRDNETVLLENFTSTNNNGDIALSKGDCPLAKLNYEKAMTIIPGELYPSEQLIKVGDCFKAKELTEKKAVEDAAAKSNQVKLAAEKLAAEKLLKESVAKEKLETAKIAKEKAAIEKSQKDKIISDKLAKEKSVKEKQEIVNLAKAKAVADNAPKAKLVAEKKLVESSAKLPVNKKTTLVKPKEKPATSKAVISPTEQLNAKPNNGAVKYSVPQAIGVNKYKETIKRADELFKMKRYTEAKSVYEDALKFKANDEYSAGRLAEIEKLKK
jgi:hypothetical protein